MLKDIFKFLSGNATKEIGNVVDNLSTSDDEKSNAKAKLTEIVMDALNATIAAQASVIKEEMRGNFLQRSWRPILMLTFGCILVAKWMGWTDPNIDLTLEQKLLDIVKYGLSGYVVGRSVEKVASTVTANIDIPFIKKKNRKVG